ncbi:MAG: helix-turn-helix domain-containing protein [Gemmatimonadota bacterium]
MRAPLPVSPTRHHSDLGRWVHAEVRPRGLAGLVDSIWYFDGWLAHPRERVFPDGRIELNVHLAEPYGQVEDDRAEAFPAICLSGVQQHTALLEAPRGGTAVLGIRLFPAGASTLLGRPLHDLTDLTVELGDVVGRAAAELGERCAAVEGAEARIRATVRWLLERAALASARADDDDAAIARVAAEIERRRGAVSIAELRKRFGWSRSRFARAFRERIGVSPKRLACIVRFRHALELLHRGDLSLSEIALRAGYYDQPHFNGDFREFAGTTPGRYLSARRYPSSVNLAEV